ncbi:hypothetical protein HID58_094390 [Brassica napus]|uniref:Uncharacterized protein n=1 Tax=Brassica napus TaxID=3708 RepID=A0ABQ7XA02_BRANA|nr:hypothetical protein HID58_094390 [Brassica napus]
MQNDGSLIFITTMINSPRIEQQQAVIETAMLNDKDGKRNLKFGESRKEVDLAKFLLEDIMRMDGKRNLKVGESRKEVDLAKFLLEDIMRMG